MSKYKGLFTFDVDNHRYLPIEQADGLISDMNYNPEPKEEPKEFWFVDSGGEVVETTYITDYDKTNLRKFGNYFETKEEAEKAVEKLKAWKRLKDTGFQFHGHNALGFGEITFSLDFEDMDDEGEIGQLRHDLDLLFGGEE